MQEKKDKEMISNTTTEKMYQDLGISREVYSFCQEILTGLEPRFKEIDENAEYNQLKVIKAMQDNKVSEACLLGTTGYGYNDLGRETLLLFSIQKMHWCVHRLPAVLMHWHWH